MSRTQWLTAAVLLLGLSTFPATVRADDEESEAFTGNSVRMSISRTLFDGYSEPLMMAMMRPFGGLMQTQTGMQGDLVACGDGLTMAEHIMKDKIQLGVFEGIEFAWARQKYPQLQPILITVNQKDHLRTFLVVHKDNPAKEWADLKGQTLAVHNHTRIHSRLFLCRNCKEAADQAPKEFFQKIVKRDTSEDMLDDVVEGVIKAAVIEEVALERYRHRKPGRSEQLRILAKSESFPATVVAFKSGKLSQATVERLRKGMLTAGKSPLGRQLMTLWKTTGFQALPENYEKTLKEIVKTYPQPEKDRSVQVTER